jgi:hypothetical protein
MLVTTTGFLFEFPYILNAKDQYGTGGAIELLDVKGQRNMCAVFLWFIYFPLKKWPHIFLSCWH